VAAALTTIPAPTKAMASSGRTPTSHAPRRCAPRRANAIPTSPPRAAPRRPRERNRARTSRGCAPIAKRIPISRVHCGDRRRQRRVGDHPRRRRAPPPRVVPGPRHPEDPAHQRDGVGTLVAPDAGVSHRCQLASEIPHLIDM